MCSNTIGIRRARSYVESAVSSILPYFKRGDILIIASTIPPGTSISIEKRISRDLHLSAPDDFGVVHCPERALPGNLYHEYVYNARIIGGSSKWVGKVKTIYNSFTKGEIVTTTAPIAEMVKLSENSFRDVNIAYAHQLKLKCDHLCVDTNEVIRIANKYRRELSLNI